MEMKYNKPSEDFSPINLGDKRLDKRLQKTVESLTEKSQSSILSSCGSKYAAKAFYALLSNEKYSHKQLTETAQKATSERIQSSGKTEVLLPQDTSDVNLDGHKKTENLGYSSEHVRGVKIHSTLALTPDGVSLGLLTQQYETRETAKIDMSKEQKSRRPIEEKESYRWIETTREALELVPENVKPIIICDREGDFYELYAEMLSLNASFVVRVTHDRDTTDGNRSIQQLRRTAACGEVEISIPRDTRKNVPARTAKMEVAYCSVAIAKPKRSGKEIPNQLVLNLVRITEIGECKEDPIEWFLATNMPVENAEDTIKIVEYYIQRWKIERFHYILKSGCQVEKIQQRTYGKIQSMLLIYSVIAAFILAMTYFARTNSDAPCDVFLEEHEWKILYRLITRKPAPPDKPYSIKTAVDYLGELGSYKHSTSDDDYGVKSIWQGLCKLFIALDVVDRLMGQV
jgi:hypothetical protein